MDNIICNKYYRKHNYKFLHHKYNMRSSIWHIREPRLRLLVVFLFLELLEQVGVAVQQRVEEPKVAGLVLVGQLENVVVAGRLEQYYLPHKLVALPVAEL